MARKRSTEARRRQRANKAARERIAKRKEHLGSWAASSRRRKLFRLSERQNHRCCYCHVITWHPDIDDGVPDNKKHKWQRATLEHIKLRMHGGTFGMYNLAMACSQCNGARGELQIDEFLDSISRPPVKPIAQPEKKLSLEAQEKINKKMGRLFRLLVVAATLYPEDFARFMELDENQIQRAVKQGKRKPKKRGRHHTLYNIRRRIHGPEPIATHSPEAMSAIG